MHFILGVTRLSFRPFIKFTYIHRAMSSSMKKGLILGVFEPESKESDDLILTPLTQQYNSSSNGRILELLKWTGIHHKKGKSRILYGALEDYPCLSVVNLGPSTASFNEQEELDEKKENIRSAVAAGAKQLREHGATTIDVDSCGDAEAAAEGGTLGLFSYDELKKKSSQKPKVDLNLVDISDKSQKEWQAGAIKASSQNLARRLMETPANLMTPTKFAEIAQTTLKFSTVTIRDKAWAEAQKMGSFLSVTQGSDEPPLFLEISYKGASSDVAPLILIGKGITFDSGGICLKPSSGMDKMRADMGGAACTLSTISALEQLKVPANVIGLIPLTENLISGHATKPGDVVIAMNGKTIQVDNTDAEGRLILADALCYAQTFNPQAIIDIATLTGAMMVALGSGVTGVFSSSNKLWDVLHKSGGVTGDRVWRMPLYSHYSRQVGEGSGLADVTNIGKYGREGGACTAAAFLREFVSVSDWAHLDIAGVMEAKDELAYLPKGMSGRPTRTLIEAIIKFFQDAAH